MSKIMVFDYSQTAVLLVLPFKKFFFKFTFPKRGGGKKLFIIFFIFLRSKYLEFWGFFP